MKDSAVGEATHRPAAGSPEPDDGSCAVQVAVHIRPLIDGEREAGCQESLFVTPGTPQVVFAAASRHHDYCTQCPAVHAVLLDRQSVF